MSQPPNYPGRDRFKKIAESSRPDPVGRPPSQGKVYEGAFEAVSAIVISIGIGYGIDSYFGTTPYGVIGGAVVGFGAFVLRLVRLGKQIHPEGAGGTAEAKSVGPDIDDEDLGTGEAPGLSSVLHDDD